MQQVLKMVVFGQFVGGIVVEAVVDLHQGPPISPQQGQGVDALRHGVLLTLPVAHDHAHVLRVGLAERRFVEHQHPSGGRAQALRLLPEQDRVGFKSVQQASVGVVRHHWPSMDVGGLYGAHRRRAGHQKLNLLLHRIFCLIHALNLPTSTNCVILIRCYTLASCHSLQLT